MFGLLTLISKPTLTSGGRRIYRFKAQIFLCCNRDSSTSRLNSKIGTKVSLEIFLKPKEKWNKSFRISTNLSSRRDSLRIGNCKQTHFNRNGTPDVSRRKSCGSKNHESNGSKKGKKHKVFSQIYHGIAGP